MLHCSCSIDELVKHDQNGLLFNDGIDLSTQIQVCLKNTYDNVLKF